MTTMIRRMKQNLEIPKQDAAYTSRFKTKGETDLRTQTLHVIKSDQLYFLNYVAQNGAPRPPD